MAEIENLKGGPDALRAMLQGFNEPELLAQQLTQRGAIHVLHFLLEHGVTTELVMEMLGSLLANMDMVVEIAQSKGYKKLFDDAPTVGFTDHGC